MSRPSNTPGDVSLADEDLLGVVRTSSDPARRRAAASELVRRYHDAVYLWCFRFTRDRERALDLSQDVLTTVWQKIGSFEGRAKFSSWIFAVTRNRCIDDARRVQPQTEDIDDIELAAAGPPPGAILEEHGEGELLHILRTQLAADEQEAVWLHYIEGVPIDEVSEMMRLESASGARAVLQRARRKLRAARAAGSGEM